MSGDLPRVAELVAPAMWRMDSETKRQVCRALAVAVTAALLTLAAAWRKKAGDDDVVASVDGRKIYRADLEKYYENQQSESEQKLSGEQATSLRLGILRQLIDNEILMRRAEKLGLLATDDEVDRKLSEIKSPFTNRHSMPGSKRRRSRWTISSARFGARSPWKKF